MSNLLPEEAWALIQGNPDALFVDVRMEIEALYVGRPPGVHMIPGYEYPSLQPEPEKFVVALSHEAGRKDRPVVLTCRSGARTVAAGRALEHAGFTDAVNATHGFEGELDDKFHRSTLSGWRFDGLPWEQM